MKRPFQNGELYSIVTNKQAKGRKGSIVVIMIKGTQVNYLIDVLNKIPKRPRKTLEEVTLDMSGSLNLSVKRRYPNIHRVIDRFHVQQLTFDAVQDTRYSKTIVGLLFNRYAVIRKACQLSLRLGDAYRVCTTKEQAFKRLALWSNDVDQQYSLPSEPRILNFFNNSGTNAAAGQNHLIPR